MGENSSLQSSLSSGGESSRVRLRARLGKTPAEVLATSQALVECGLTRMAPRSREWASRGVVAGEVSDALAENRVNAPTPASLGPGEIY